MSNKNFQSLRQGKIILSFFLIELNRKQLKGVHPIIFVSNIFPNSEFDSETYTKSAILYTFQNQMRIGKNIQHKDDRMNSL